MTAAPKSRAPGDFLAACPNGAFRASPLAGIPSWASARTARSAMTGSWLLAEAVVRSTVCCIVVCCQDAGP
jgi:hypothetical protein